MPAAIIQRALTVIGFGVARNRLGVAQKKQPLHAT
jgi:hypothetical protein